MAIAIFRTIPKEIKMIMPLDSPYPLIFYKGEKIESYKYLITGIFKRKAILKEIKKNGKLIKLNQ